ncbi:7549_t:CDS:2 [Entrophospora sp. SA101]|nr:7549_t:CDS:2 [Entrophospora sp. SA101]CAJ0883087.1 1975_t:CDS:2 [Entrophospora sp. SA101]
MLLRLDNPAGYICLITRIVEILRQMKNSDISEILVSQHEKQGWIINVDKSSFILLK